MKNQLNAMLLTAALSGLIGGTTVAAHAQSTSKTTVKAAKVGLRYTSDDKTFTANQLGRLSQARVAIAGLGAYGLGAVQLAQLGVGTGARGLLRNQDGTRGRCGDIAILSQVQHERINVGHANDSGQRIDAG